MKMNCRLAIGLALVGIVSLSVMVVGAAIEMVLGQTFAVGDGMAMIWIWGFIVLPILLAMVVFQPRIILLAIAMAIPLGLMFYGAVNHIDIHTKWYFSIITIVCTGYMAGFLLRSLRNDRDGQPGAVGNEGHHGADSRFWKS